MTRRAALLARPLRDEHALGPLEVPHGITVVRAWDDYRTEHRLYCLTGAALPEVDDGCEAPLVTRAELDRLVADHDRPLGHLLPAGHLGAAAACRAWAIDNGWPELAGRRGRLPDEAWVSYRAHLAAGAGA